MHGLNQGLHGGTSGCVCVRACVCRGGDRRTETLLKRRQMQLAEKQASRRRSVHQPPAGRRMATCTCTRTAKKSKTKIQPKSIMKIKPVHGDTCTSSQRSPRFHFLCCSPSRRSIVCLRVSIIFRFICRRVFILPAAEIMRICVTSSHLFAH